MALIRGKIIATSHGWFEFRTWRWCGGGNQLTPVEDLGEQQA
jgi:hypothetical protein